MAALTYQGTMTARRNVSVVASTTDGIGAATACVVFDNTKNKDDLLQALEGIRRRISRDFGKRSKPSGVPTSGTTIE